MKLFYSATNNAFYDPTINPSIPAGAVEITREQHAELMQAQAKGATIRAGTDGLPKLYELPALSAGDYLGLALMEVRGRRATIMSVLDGLQVSAMCNGDGTAPDIEKTKQALRDITKAEFAKGTTDFDAAFLSKLEEIAEECPVPAARKVITSAVVARRG